MSLRSRRIILVCMLYLPAASAQTAPAPKPMMADDVFKNVKVLKGISVNEFMSTMGMFSASLGLNCTYCHVTDSLKDWSKFAEDVPRKSVARTMIQMVTAINKQNFGGRNMVSCYSCHRGAERPKVIPSLADQYSVPPEDPNEVEIVGQAPAGPSADQILDKYIQALGGAQRLNTLTSLTARGTYDGFDTYHIKVPLEVFGKAPGQLTTIVHTQNGDSTTTFDGRAGWIASPDKPVPLLPMTAGGELDGARFDAELLFPGRIKQILGQWRVGFPPATIDDREVQIVQGTGAGGTRMKLYFEKQSGLLTRVVRYTGTIVGVIPTQIDYADYREVAGVKVPFHWTVTWTNGQSIIELSDVQPNVAIDAAKFARPAPAVVTPAR